MSTEKIFTPHDLPDLVVVDEGIYASAGFRPDFLEFAGVMPDTTPLWRQPLAESEQVGRAIELRQNPVVRGIGMLAAIKSNEVTLPVAFAAHLTEHRAQNRGMLSACVVSETQPNPPTDYVRLPHLVTYTPQNQAASDTVMWELLHESEASRWLGNSLPDQQLIESHLPNLLQIRSAWRIRQLPETHRFRELAELLDKGRYLSILFVYQHFGLFEAILQEKSAN